MAALALDVRPHLLARLERRAAGTESVRAVQEVGLDDRLDDQLRGRLDDAIPDGGNAEHALAPLRLGDRNPPDCERAVGSLAQLCFELIEELVHPLLADCVDGLAVDAGRAAASLDLSPGAL